MITVRKAETQSELQGILDLQRKNFKNSVSVSEARQEGFVTVKHELKTLLRMQSYEPQIIAIDKDRVVGYALVMVTALRDTIEVLKPMFETLDGLEYDGRHLSEASYYIMGQVCIDKAFRGKGIFSRLYQEHRSAFGDSYDYCITEVSENNGRSMRAHIREGFEVIHRFRDHTDEWNILLLNLKE